jgi:hypothetical protein
VCLVLLSAATDHSNVLISKEFSCEMNCLFSAFDFQSKVVVVPSAILRSGCAFIYAIEMFASDCLVLLLHEFKPEHLS